MRRHARRVVPVLLVCGLMLLYLTRDSLWAGIRTRHETVTSYQGDVVTNLEVSSGQIDVDDTKSRLFPYDKRFKNPCWYLDNGELRCLPYFFVVGVRKCGTTQIWNYIMCHPETLRPYKKENNIFGYDQIRTYPDSILKKKDEYVSYFKDVSMALEQLTNRSTGLNNYIFGDGSTSSMYVNRFWRMYPGNENLQEPKYVALDFVHSFLPNTKVIICFRNPTDRLYSEYYFTYGQLHNETDLGPESFHELAENAIEQFNDCLRNGTIRECVSGEVRQQMKPKIFKILVYLGIYYVYMEDLIRIYGRDQILVLHIEDLGQTSTLANIFEFLDISMLSEDKEQEIVDRTEKINSRRGEFSQKGPMLNATRHLLDEFYRPYNEIMAFLVNDDNFLYAEKSPSASQ